MKKVLASLVTIIMILGILSIPVNSFATVDLVKGEPKWDASYKNKGQKVTPAPSTRTDASGDKITSNAHSADFPGIYFYWDDKQKDEGVLLVQDKFFNLFENENSFYITTKNSNEYWDFPIVKGAGEYVATGVAAYKILKNFEYTNAKGQKVKVELKNINMVFIGGDFKGSLEVSVSVNKEHTKITLQDEYQRTKQEIRQNRIQEEYQRTSQEITQRTIQRNYQRTVQKIYEPIYEVIKVASGDGGAYVTWIGSASDTIGGYIPPVNGHTYATINVNAIRAAGSTGKYFEIGGLQNHYEQKRPGYGYTVTIVGDKLRITFDENLISVNIGGYIANTVEGLRELQTAPGNPATEIHLPTASGGRTYEMNMPEGYGDTVYLYAHFRGIHWYKVSSTTFKGWELVNTITGKYKLVSSSESDSVRTKYSDYELVGTESEDKLIHTKYGRYKLINEDVEVKREIVKDKYEGTLNLLITNSKGDEIYNGPIANNGKITREYLPKGEYTCVLTGDGFAAQTKIGEVKSNKQTKVAFSVKVVGDDETVKIDPKNLVDRVLDAKYIKDKVTRINLDDRVLDPKRIKDKIVRNYLPDNVVPRYPEGTDPALIP